MLNPLILGQRHSIHSASDACFTKDNSTSTSTTINASTPKGVLGGSVATYGSADYTVAPCTKTTKPVGLFLKDAAGAPFENSTAVASGKVTVIRGMASVEVDVYETQTAADADVALVYAIGDALYSSAGGLLTKEVSTDETIIGYVTKVPTTTSPLLGLDMAI